MMTRKSIEGILLWILSFMLAMGFMLVVGSVYNMLIYMLFRDVFGINDEHILLPIFDIILLFGLTTLIRRVLK